MPHCRVFGCNGHSGMKGIRMLCFPKDTKLAMHWLVLCRCEIRVNVSNYVISHEDRVCSRHFDDNDFEYSPRDKMLIECGVQLKKMPHKMIKSGVCPHINMPRQEVSTPRTSAYQARKHEQEDKQRRKRTCAEMLQVTTPSSQQLQDKATPQLQHGGGSNKTCNETPSSTPQCTRKVLFAVQSSKQGSARRAKKKTTEVRPSLVSTGTQTETQPANLPSNVSMATQTEENELVPKKEMQTQAPEVKPYACPRTVQKDHTYSCLSKPKRKKNKTKAPMKRPKPVYKDDTEDFIGDDTTQDKTDAKDADYQPGSDEESSDDEEDTEASKPEQLVNQRKFIIFESQLHELFMQARCSICGHYFMLDENYLGEVIGSGLVVKLECVNKHKWVWHSQPMLGRMPVGNLLISAAILFSGQTFSHISSFAGFMNLEFVGSTTYGNHQSDYLFPAVHTTFESEKQSLWSSLDSKAVRLAGDGRCDSPGYSAKFCTYTVMDMDSQKVVDFEVVQVSQATSSVAMEKLGFDTVVKRLLANNIDIVQICTDRHVGINALMNKDERLKKIDHQVDVWHLGKSIFKRLLNKSKQSECQDLQKWLPSIRNHLWWSSATCDGDPILLQEKWKSLGHHVTNNHEWDANQKFHKCVHQPIPPDSARRKKWLKEDSPAHQAIVSTLNDKRLLKGVNKITAFCHTGQLEVFNGMLTKYTPKRQHFPQESMVVRTKLAVLDHNKNTGRQQAVVQHPTCKSAPKGSKRYRVVCPKAKKEWVAKPIYEGKRYDHVYDMMASVVSRKMANDKQSIFEPPALPPNIAPHERGSKAAIIEALNSRFAKS